MYFSLLLFILSTMLLPSYVMFWTFDPTSLINIISRVPPIGFSDPLSSSHCPEQFPLLVWHLVHSLPVLFVLLSSYPKGISVPSPIQTLCLETALEVDDFSVSLLITFSFLLCRRLSYKPPFPLKIRQLFDSWQREKYYI